MNASVNLLERSLPSAVHLSARVAEAHPSAGILGVERAGTGVVIDPGEWVLTAHYVVLGASRMVVTLLDGRAVEGEVAAQDFLSGLALVRMRGAKAPALRLRHSRDVRPGEEVFIVASMGGTVRRVTTGCVTCVGPFDAFWEYTLDRAIMATPMNPGLGGGPLIDSKGMVIGVVSLNLNEVGRFSLAVPSECFLDHRAELLRHGRRASVAARAWLGLTCYAFREHIVVHGVLAGGPGDRGGLRAGDVILAIDGKNVSERRQLYEELWRRPAGARVSLRIFRDNSVTTLDVPTGDIEEFFA